MPLKSRRPASAVSRWETLLVLIAILLPACKGEEPASAPVPPIRPTPMVMQSTPTPISTPVLTMPESLQSWSVQRRFVLEAIGRSADRSITISSDGLVVREESSGSSSLGSKDTHTRTQSRLSPASIAKLRKALEDPELARQTASPALAPSRQSWRLTVTLDGKSGTFLSNSRTFPGAAGRLADVFASVLPPPPAPKK